MKKSTLKISLMLLLFFLLDVKRPLGDSLLSEFLFIGVVFISLRCSLSKALLFSLIFGYIKYCFSYGENILNFLELPLICLFTKYLLAHSIFMPATKHFKVFRFIIILISIFVHILFNSALVKAFVPFYSLIFMLQSFFILVLLDYFLTAKIVSSANS